MRQQRRVSAVGGAQGNGGRRGNRRSGRKPDQGNGGRGRNRRNRGKTAVDASRKETADRVAKAPGRPVSETCLCYSCRQLLQLVRTWSSFVFVFCALVLRDFHIVYLYFFLFILMTGVL